MAAELANCIVDNIGEYTIRFVAQKTCSQSSNRFHIALVFLNAHAFKAFSFLYVKMRSTKYPYIVDKTALMSNLPLLYSCINSEGIIDAGESFHDDKRPEAS